MKSFYSLIKLAPNEMSGDTLTIGIILSSSNGFQVKFSRLKKNVIKSFLAVDNSIIDFLESEIVTKVKDHNKFVADNKKGLFELPTLLNSDYFLYLSKYSNGLLKFTSPVMIADSIDDNMFDKLFSILVDGTGEKHKRDDSSKQIEKAFYHKVETNLISRVKDKVHTNLSLDNKIVPSLFNSFQIDCLGLNGVLIGAKSLPFTQSKETLHKTINTYISIIAHLTSEYNKTLDGNKFYLISDQPAKGTQEYILWEQLLNSEKIIKIISSDESGEVAELIEDCEAKTFI